MKKTLTTFLAGFLMLFATTNSNADVVRYNLGEQDPGAADGIALMSSTFGSPGPALTLQGSGGTYSSIAAPGGSSLSASFDGSQSYSETGSGFYSGIDLTDFVISFDARATGNASGFSIAAAFGQGGSGSLFVYHTGEGAGWRLHSNGLGDLIDSASNSVTVTYGQWYNFRIERSVDTMSFYVDGNLMGTTVQFTPGGTLGDTLTIGAHRTGTGIFEGRFQGQVDNVSAIPEPSFAGLLGLSCIGLVSRRRRV